MNAVTSIAAADPECAYRAAISVHCPNENEMKLACRVDLARLRDQASAALSRCSDASFGVLSEIARQATLAVYARTDTATLFRTRNALTLTMTAARALEAAARPREHGGG